MQRLFTVFPSGVPGVALFLLRSAVAATLWQPFLAGVLGPSGVLLIALCFFSVLLVVGLATPIAATIAFIWLMQWLDPFLLLGIVRADTLSSALNGVFALSLALLGPGAFSMDALLFGRRVLRSS